MQRGLLRQEFSEQLADAVSIIGVGDAVADGLDGSIGIAHGYSAAGVGEHGQIVVAIAEGDDRFTGNVQALGQSS